MKMEFFGPPGCGKTYIVENIRGISRESIKAKANNPMLSKIKRSLGTHLYHYTINIVLKDYYQKKLYLLVFMKHLSQI